jgi:hypothetical protein
MPAPKVTKFAGNIRLWRINADGTRTPAIPNTADVTGNQPVEANAAVMSREAGDTVEIKSKQRGNRYNQPVYSEQEPGTSKLSLTLLEVPPMILARVLYGSAAAEVAVTAGSVSAEPVSVTTTDVPLQLAHRYLDEATPLVAHKGATTLVAGTDFDVDYRRGQIKFKGTNVSAGDSVTVDYEYLAHSKVVIQGGGTPTESFYITGDMENRVSGEQGELEIYEAKLAIDGDVDLLGSDPISPVLAGSLIVPSDKSTPYEFTSYALTA